MKLRNGFVSNSSSSSFIVCIPEDFKQKDFENLATMENLENEYKNKYDATIFENYTDGSDKEKRELREKVINAFSVLKEQSHVSEWSRYKKDGDEKRVGYLGLSINQIFEHQDMVLDKFPTDPEGGMIRNVCTPDNIKKLKKLL